eukprot:CAMPEP_0114984740 /NCGR_PEP_ID=MMETSP0216-20121206/7446_1 /TAXON_ID=223996 /ORGANISM="Protocruzia adherens, Strain Boccale" /LENGTH=323 /DNA_ID=CAMNT_0002346913 /DNA_START=24 /DNA_END=995 /DNA_ORIENTATION=-
MSDKGEVQGQAVEDTDGGELNKEEIPDVNDPYDEILEEENKFDIPALEKERGTVLFRQQKYEEASKHYAKAILAVTYLFSSGMIEERKELAPQLVDEVQIPCNLNLALCYLKLEIYPHVIHHCNKVLELRPENTKALYRRACAHMKTGEYEIPRRDLKLLLERDPNDTNVRAAMTELKKKIQDYHKQSKAVSSKMFASSKDSEPSKGEKTQTAKCGNVETSSGTKTRRGLLQILLAFIPLIFGMFQELFYTTIDIIKAIPAFFLGWFTNIPVEIRWTASELSNILATQDQSLMTKSMRAGTLGALTPLRYVKRNFQGHKWKRE